MTEASWMRATQKSYGLYLVAQLAAACVSVGSLSGCLRNVDIEFDNSAFFERVQQVGSIANDPTVLQLEPQTIESGSSAIIPIAFEGTQNTNCVDIKLTHKVEPASFLLPTGGVALSGTWPMCKLVITPSENATGDSLLELEMLVAQRLYTASVKISMQPSVASAEEREIIYANASGITGAAGSEFLLNPAVLNTGGFPVISCKVEPPLPSGLSINSESCIISGTPMGPSELTEYLVTARTAAGSSVANLYIAIAPPGQIALKKGIPVSESLSVTDEVDRFAISVSSGGAVWFDLSFPDCDASCWRASIVDSNDTVLASKVTPSNAAVDMTIQAQVQQAGVYFLKVEAQPDWSPLSFTVEGKALAARDLPSGTAGFVSVSDVKGIQNVSTVNSSNLNALLNNPLYKNRVWDTGYFTVNGVAGAAWSFLWNLALVDTVYVRAQRFSTYNPQWSVAGSFAGGPYTTTTSSIEYPFSMLNGPSGSATLQIENSSNGLIIQDIAFYGAGEPVPVTWMAADTPSLGYANGRALRSTSSSLTPVSPNSHDLPVLSCTAEPALPLWAKIDPWTCAISGTPTELSAPKSYVISASNAVGIATFSLDLSVVDPNPPAMSYADTTAYIGEALTINPINFDAKGEAVISCEASPQLPAWASIDPATCVVTGTPNEILSATVYTITATTFLGSGTAELPLHVIYPQTPYLSYASSSGKTGTVGTPMSISPSESVSLAGDITSCSATPALPAGLTIDTLTCVITGTPTSGSNKITYSVQATNAAGQGTAATLDLAVGESSGQKTVLSVTSTPIRKYLNLAAGDYFLLRGARTSDPFNAQVTTRVEFGGTKTTSSSWTSASTNVTFELRNSSGTKACGLAPVTVTGTSSVFFDLGCNISISDTYELYVVGSTEPTVKKTSRWGGKDTVTTTTTPALKLQVHFDALVSGSELNIDAFSATAGLLNMTESEVPLPRGEYVARRFDLASGMISIKTATSVAQTDPAWRLVVYSPSGAAVQECGIYVSPSGGTGLATSSKSCNISTTGSYLVLLTNLSNQNSNVTIDLELTQTD